jgi:transposase
MSKKSISPQDWREGRRMRAWELHEQGWKQKDIAAALGVSEGAVSQWFKKAKVQGEQALRHQPAPGATPKLSAQQRAQLPTELSKGAEAFGFRGQVWTTERVAQMIKQVFGVSYHPAHCSRLLRSIKYSQQKPIQKATQRDEAAIQRWKDERWEALKKRPKTKSGPSRS